MTKVSSEDYGYLAEVIIKTDLLGKQEIILQRHKHTHTITKKIAHILVLSRILSYVLQDGCNIVVRFSANYCNRKHYVNNFRIDGYAALEK